MYKNDLFQNEKATFHLEGGFCVLEEFQLSRRVVERQAVVGRESVSGNRLAVVAGGVCLVHRCQCLNIQGMNQSAGFDNQDSGGMLPFGM